MTGPSVIAFDVLRWIEQGKLDLDKPMMHHARVVDDRFIVMVFDAPTPPERSDFHINTAAEFFYQIEGEMACRILRHDAHGSPVFDDHVVGPGQLFYIPPGVPHRNRRDAHSTGLVIHEQRAPDADDVIVWYCQQCAHELHRVAYAFTELRRNLKQHIAEFLADADLRTCDACGWTMPADQGRLL